MPHCHLFSELSNILLKVAEAAADSYIDIEGDEKRSIEYYEVQITLGKVA